MFTFPENIFGWVIVGLTIYEYTLFFIYFFFGIFVVSLSHTLSLSLRDNIDLTKVRGREVKMTQLCLLILPKIERAWEKRRTKGRRLKRRKGTESSENELYTY
jgi:hypothetical protein